MLPVDEFDRGEEPLTDDEVKEVTAFYLDHWHPFGLELQHLIARGLVPKLPLLFRLAFDDMRRIQAGRPPRHTFNQLPEERNEN
jgi:hypothetical protein